MPASKALKSHWDQRASQRSAECNTALRAGSPRRGVGVAGMWYGCGNTSLADPSTIRLGLKSDGRLALHQGAVDIGRGRTPSLRSSCADALGAPIDAFRSRLRRYRPDARIAARPPPRARPSSRARRRQLAGAALRRPDPAPRQCRGGCDGSSSQEGQVLLVQDGGIAHRSTLPRLPLMPRRLRARRRRNLRPADQPARCRRPGRTLCRLWLRRASRRACRRYRVAVRSKLLKITAAA